MSNEDPSLYRPIPSEPGFEHELVLSCYFDTVWQVEIKTSTWRQQSQHWKNRIVAWFTRQVRNVVLIVICHSKRMRLIQYISFEIVGIFENKKEIPNKLTNKPQTGPPWRNLRLSGLQHRLSLWQGKRSCITQSSQSRCVAELAGHLSAINWAHWGQWQGDRLKLKLDVSRKQRSSIFSLSFWPPC